MKNLKQAAIHIQRLAIGVKDASEKLLTLAGDSQVNPAYLQKTLEQLAIQYEQSTLMMRSLCEEARVSKDGIPGKKPSLPFLEVAGSVELIENHWLHIRLETLLPHCRYQTPDYLSDTISRLLDMFEARGQVLPFFRHALLVVDEHSSINCRRVFDQDNKGWKAIPNALKGRVIPDDDQYSLGVALLSANRPDNVCHITLMEVQEASDFFALRSEPYAMDSMYQGF